jgi:hypothetical protein
MTQRSPGRQVCPRETTIYQGAPLPAQAVITRTITVAPGPFAPGHLGELTQIVPFDLIDEILIETRAVQTRVRDLPSRVVVYLLLAGCLFTIPQAYQTTDRRHLFYVGVD